MSVFEDTTFNDLSDQTLATKLSQQNPVVMILNGADLGKRYILDDASSVIGRNPEQANIVLTDRAVSSMHTRIDYNARKRRFFITDLHSKNGIWVNSQRTDNASLSPGDKIFIGSTVLKFTLEDAFEDRFHSRVDELMNIDELTGLPIKRVFDQKLSLAFLKAKRRGKTLSLLMMDMDGLKRINDTHGHQLGSHSISECGRIIGGIVGNKGTACRYGGDEFIAFLHKMTLAEAEAVGESIRQSIAKHTCKLNGHSASPTISIGVAELSNEAESPDELVRSADEALYRAKEAGRNTVSR
ncbi:MAG: GGDEF domain-containing protein [Anaerolineales bacterium]|nr:GGDEF domain-containing protein [Anaerolineales bacterium]